MKTELESAESLLRRNLSDAGCDAETMDSIVKMQRSGDTARVAAVLNKLRRTLLERVHLEQRRIDCLDYFLNNLKQNTNSVKGTLK